jgi:putative ABC transport system substrate-binding protein
MDSRRRSLLCLAGASAVLPCPLLAQSKEPKRIVWVGAGDQVRVRAREEFKSRGIVEARDIALTFQPGFSFDNEQKADELVRTAPHVIVLRGDGALWPLRKRTRDVPIVFYNMWPDPVDFGLIESFARPGGNLTGSSVNATEWSKKVLEILKQLVPALKLVGDLTDKGSDDFERAEPEFVARNKERIRRENAQLGIDNVVLQVSRDHRRDEIARVVKASGIQVLMSPGFSPEAREFAISAPIPTVCPSFAMAKKGCLLGWSFDWTEGVSYAVQAVQRILRGDSPAVIPVYQARIEYALNRKRAHELGIEIPPAVLLGAREVYD